ncbi:MAG: 1,2-phenylacetyl-CoA epoxidase subunit PaaD [Bacteroidota bacterium]
MPETQVTEAVIRHYLDEVPDPEIPVLSIADLGIIREVHVAESGVEVVITPTYSGCPAMQVIEDDIRQKLQEKGVEKVAIRTVISPSWTTDWISEAGKRKLEAYGIAPPPRTTASKKSLMGLPDNLRCPRCHSEDVAMVSQFGSTPCKALYQCHSCMEPFDHFKCL